MPDMIMIQDKDLDLLLNIAEKYANQVTGLSKELDRIRITATLPEIINATEAATLLHIHPRTVKKMIANNEIAGAKIGREWRLRREHVLALVPT